MITYSRYKILFSVFVAILLFLFAVYFIEKTHKQDSIDGNASIQIPINEILKIVKRISHENRIPEAVLREVAAKFETENISMAELPSKLRDWADKYAQLKSIIAELGENIPQIKQLKIEAHFQLEKGDLVAATKSVDDCLSAISHLEEQAAIDKASVLRIRAEIYFLEFRYYDAGVTYELAASALKAVSSKETRELRWQYQLVAADAFRVSATNEEGFAAWKRAISVYESIVSEIDKTQYPHDWFYASQRYAAALGLAGYQEEIHEYTNESVRIYEELLDILNVMEFEGDERIWAEIQIMSAIGLGYKNMGDIESNTAYLEKSYNIHVKTVTEINKIEGHSLNWGYAMHNLAETTGAIAESCSCLAAYEEAVDLWEKSLEGITEERAPGDHWVTVGGLSDSLVALALFSTDIRYLDRALKLEENRIAALEKVKDEQPLDYAMAKSSYADVLFLYVDNNINKDFIEKALKKYNDSLRYITYERAPLRYVATIYNLASLDVMLADLDESKGIKLVERSIKRLLEAKTYMSSGGKMEHQFRIDYRLALSYAALAEKNGGDDHFNKAIGELEGLSIQYLNIDGDIEVKILKTISRMYIMVANKNRRLEDYENALKAQKKYWRFLKQAGYNEGVARAEEQIREIEKNISQYTK